jgi:hypothetical protein
VEINSKTVIGYCCPKTEKIVPKAGEMALGADCRKYVDRTANNGKNVIFFFIYHLLFFILRRQTMTEKKKPNTVGIKTVFGFLITISISCTERILP